MDESRLKKSSLHILSILICIIIPSSLLYTNFFLIPGNFLISLSYIYSPLIVMLILYIFGHKYLTSIEVELYGGLSSRFLLLTDLLVIKNISIEIFGIPYYGFITPIEWTIIFMLAPVTESIYRLSSFILNTIVILSSLFIIILYLYLIFIGRKFQEEAMKIYYLIAIIIGFIFSIGALTSRFLAYIGGLQLLFVAFTAYRWINKFTKYTTVKDKVSNQKA